MEMLYELPWKNQMFSQCFQLSLPILPILLKVAFCSVNAQHQAPLGCNFSSPLWPCPGAAQTPPVWGEGSVAELHLSFKVVEGSAELWWHMGCLCPVLPPASSVQPLVPSAACADCPPSEVPVGAEQKGDACRQCSLLSSIAR